MPGFNLSPAAFGGGFNSLNTLLGNNFQGQVLLQQLQAAKQQQQNQQLQLNLNAIANLPPSEQVPILQKLFPKLGIQNYTPVTLGGLLNPSAPTASQPGTQPAGMVMPQGSTQPSMSSQTPMQPTGSMGTIPASRNGLTPLQTKPLPFLDDRLNQVYLNLDQNDPAQAGYVKALQQMNTQEKERQIESQSSVTQGIKDAGGKANFLTSPDNVGIALNAGNQGLSPLAPGTNASPFQGVATGPDGQQYAYPLPLDQIKFAHKEILDPIENYIIAKAKQDPKLIASAAQQLQQVGLSPNGADIIIAADPDFQTLQKSVKESLKSSMETKEAKLRIAKDTEELREMPIKLAQAQSRLGIESAHLAMSRELLSAGLTDKSTSQEIKAANLALSQARASMSTLSRLGKDSRKYLPENNAAHQAWSGEIQKAQGEVNSNLKNAADYQKQIDAKTKDKNLIRAQFMNSMPIPGGEGP